jgi:hypothetical protein
VSPNSNASTAWPADSGDAAPVAIRVNPNVDARTHAKITTGTYENKFGIAFEQVEAVYARADRLKHIRLRGLQMHIGSQLTEVAPFAAAVERVAPLARRLGPPLRYRLPQCGRRSGDRLPAGTGQRRSQMVAQPGRQRSADTGKLTRRR